MPGWVQLAIAGVVLLVGLSLITAWWRDHFGRGRDETPRG